MPEFQIDLGDMPATFRALDSFTQGYIEAAFWTESGEPDSPCYEKALSDLAPITLASMIEDCVNFQELAQADLEKAYDYTPSNYDAAHAGHDFWLTRNGHGAGFWDRGFGDLRTETVGGRLSRDAKSFGGCDLYQGDDGLIYLG